MRRLRGATGDVYTPLSHTWYNHIPSQDTKLHAAFSLTVLVFWFLFLLFFTLHFINLSSSSHRPLSFSFISPFFSSRFPFFLFKRWQLYSMEYVLSQASRST